MNGLKVKWTEFIDLPEMFWDDFIKNGNADDLRINYEGEVINSHKSFFEGTYLIVACTDKKIRTVNINKVEII